MGEIVTLHSALSEEDYHNATETVNLLRQTKAEHCDAVIDFSIEQLFSIFRSSGFFNVEGRMNVKDVMMLENSIGALLYRYFQLEHPFHAVTDEIIRLEDEEGPEDEAEEEQLELFND